MGRNDESKSENGGSADKKERSASASGPEGENPEQKRAEAEEERTRLENGRQDDAQEKEERERSAVSNGSDAASDSASRDAGVSEVFPVVGIGASAGGLEALEAFFENLPVDSGIAFVVVTHTDPNHESLLPGIVRRKTKVPVKQIEEGMSLAPDTVYLPPSNRDPQIRGEAFRLKKRPETSKLHMPIDQFFVSLATARGERAGCLILSGTGTDGTQGLRSIKERGGVSMVQAPESARHTGMPISALDTGLVDYRLEPGKMPRQLKNYFSQSPPVEPSAEREEKWRETKSFQNILAFLANRTRHDFSHYKDGTLTRRINRRIVVTQSSGEDDYLRKLHRDGAEVRALFQDLLIGVTRFFRDPEAWGFLKNQVLKERIREKEPGQNLRVWVPGCATGEEAYSAAIVVKELMVEVEVSLDVQIFATDIDPKAIERARTGKYLQNIFADVGQERIERFFAKEGEWFRVKQEVREPVVFAEQNLLRDPPFSNLDLLVCRNLLIYLKAAAQERLLPLFHYTLKNEGILFLGNSETVGRFPELFLPLSKTHSIFRKKEVAVIPQVRFPAEKTGIALPEVPEEVGHGRRFEGSSSLEQAVKSVLLEAYSPTALALDPEGRILYTHGATGKYLELARGKPNLNVADMAREGLRFPLLSGIRRAKSQAEPVRETDIRVKTNGGYQGVDLTIRKFGNPPLKDTFLLVLRDRPEPEQKDPTPADADSQTDDKERIEELEQELMRLREDYRSAMEELETSNEELRSSNEEMQSSNEELQSTNEELESSREELQSLNEELNTVNSELQDKMEELDQSYEAVTHVLNSTRIALIFLDCNLCLTRFTSEAANLVNLIDSDVGRPLEHISNKLGRDGLSDKAGRVLENLTPIEEEAQTEDGHWYRMNVMVHRRDDHVIEGVVITFVNIDEQKKAQEEVVRLAERNVQAAERFAESIVETVREGLLVLDEDLRVVSANQPFYDMFEMDRDWSVGKSLFELGSGQWDIPDLRSLLEEIVKRRQAFEDYRISYDFPGIGKKRMLLNARHLEEKDETRNRILLAIEDITDRSDG